MTQRTFLWQEHVHACVCNAGCAAGCLILSPPKLSGIYNTDSLDMSKFNDTQWTPEGSARTHDSSAHLFSDSHHNPFYEREQEALAPLLPTEQLRDSSSSPTISGRAQDKCAVVLYVGARSASPASPDISASESETEPAHGATAPCPTARGQLPGDSLNHAAAAENAACQSWRQGSRRHSFVLGSKKPKGHESPRSQSNVFCPPATCDVSGLETRASSRRAAVDNTMAFFERQVSKSGLMSQSSGGKPSGGFRGVLLPRGGNSTSKLVTGVQAGADADAKAGGTRRKSLQLLWGMRDCFVSGARDSASAGKAPGAKSRQKNRKAESNSFNVAKWQSLSSKAEIDASGASAPCISSMHDDGGAAAEPRPETFETSKSNKKQRHSFSASMGLTDLWQKSLRGFGIQRRRSQQYAAVRPPVRGGSLGTPPAAALELTSAETSHDADEAKPMHVQKRWSFQSFTRRKASADAPAGVVQHRRSIHAGAGVQDRPGKQAWGPPRAVDAVHVGSAADPSQHAAHRTQRKARSFQDTEAVPVAYNHSMQGIDEASAIQNLDPLDQDHNDFKLQERSVAMRAQLAQQSQRSLHAQMEEERSRGSVDRALGVGRQGTRSINGSATGTNRASRMSLDVGKFFRGRRTPSMHANRHIYAEHVGGTVAGVEGKSASFGRGSFEAGPAGKYRRMHASWRSCVFPLLESDTETSSAQS